MTKPERSAEGRRQQLLERLRAFEDAAEKVHPEILRPEIAESLERFRAAAEELRLHLSQHLALKETIDWPQLPDSGVEISAYANELKTEHGHLLEELAQLTRAAEEMEKTLDRVDAASQLRTRSLALALRIARHAGEEEAPMGHYL